MIKEDLKFEGVLSAPLSVPLSVPVCSRLLSSSSFSSQQALGVGKSTRDLNFESESERCGKGWVKWGQVQTL